MVLSTFWQFSNFKPNQDSGTSNAIMTSILPLKRLRLLEQKRTGSQFHYIMPLTKQTFVLTFTERNTVSFFNDKSEEPLINSKTSRDPYLDQDLTMTVYSLRPLRNHSVQREEEGCAPRYAPNEGIKIFRRIFLTCLRPLNCI
jgi:hypothetical protein